MMTTSDIIAALALFFQLQAKYVLNISPEKAILNREL